MELPDLENMKKYVPEQLKIYSVMGMLCQSYMFEKRTEVLTKSFSEVAKSYKRYNRLVHSNNWLKMHGYPMRRKGRKGSKKS